MCGIAGFSAGRDEEMDAAHVARALLLGIEERGRHATGAAFVENHQTYLAKAAQPASTFVHTLPMRPDARVAILHTRFATQGSPECNENNHPIDVGGIVGVHNGVVFNDNALFSRLAPGTRTAEVDSEAIFASLLHRTESTTSTLSEIDGSAAVAWLQTTDDTDLLHVARVCSSPLLYAFTEAGSFLFASTASALQSTARACNLTLVAGPYALSEGTYLTVRDGEVRSKQTFDTGRPQRALSTQERLALNLA
jgi:glucosamine 6-phosphate synthetase-like amidotransferase/phosphosugar isomerase protein